MSPVIRAYVSISLLLLALAFISGCVPAETCVVVLYGSTTGSSTGTGVPGVNVKIEENALSAISDAEGGYRTAEFGMKPGKLTVTFSKEGYLDVVKQVPVSTSGRIQVDATMFPETEGRALVDFEFTLVNDYEAGTFLGDYDIPAPTAASSAVASQAPVEAEGVVIYPARGTGFGASMESIASYEIQVMESDPVSGYILVGVPEGKDAEGFSRELINQTWVDFAEPDYVCFPLGEYVPDDFLWPMQWGPRMVSMHRAWEFGFSGDPVVIAVVDTGVFVEHPDLEGRCLPMLNTINTDMLDNDGHGTHVAGIIGAVMDNIEGMAGVNKGAAILPVKALEKTGLITSGTMTSISRGVRQAAENGADVISMSLGWPLIFSDCTFRLLKEALDYADSMGIALVAASGNDSSATDITMPAKYEKCFAVSSVNPFYSPPSYANTGSGTDIFAPGGGSGVQSVVSTVPYTRNPKGYARMAGTSMATPHMSAIMGALMAKGLSVDDAKSAILSSSQYIEGYEMGLVNAYAALAGARGSRAIFWLCDDAGVPLTDAFRGSDGSRDMTIFGDYEGHAWVCGWVGLTGSEEPQYGDFLGFAEVWVESGMAAEIPSMLRLGFYEPEAPELVVIKYVPAVRQLR